MIRQEFAAHQLNERGLAQDRFLAQLLSDTLASIEQTCGMAGRDVALVRTHLELAGFYAKRAMASHPENQQAL